MPITIDPIRPGLPPVELIAQPAIRKAAEAHATAESAAYAADRDVTQLQNDRAAAVERDRRAYADAIRKRQGAADPGTPETDAHDAKIETAKRTAAARQLVREDTFRELCDALAAHGPAWHEQNAARVAEARDELRDALAHARTALSAYSVARGLAHFTNPDRDEHGRGRSYSAVGLFVPVHRSSDPRAGAEPLLDALDTLTVEAEQRAPPVVYRGGLRVAGEDAA